MSNIAALTRDTVDESVLQAECPVFIDVWGPQCSPCLALAPTFEALAERFGDKGSFLKLEAPKNRMACVELGVMNLPTLLHYENGREVGRLTGEISRADLEKFVERAFADGKG
jgi:thioredoxin 1